MTSSLGRPLRGLKRSLRSPRGRLVASLGERRRGDTWETATPPISDPSAAKTAAANRPSWSINAEHGLGREETKARGLRDQFSASLTLSLPKVTNIDFLLTVIIHHWEKSVWELTKWSKGIILWFFFKFSQHSLSRCMEISLENSHVDISGAAGLKGFQL